MSMRPLDIPWPTAGINRNAPPSELAANEAYELQNMMVTESEARIRNPVRYGTEPYGGSMSVAYGDAIMSVRSIGSSITISLMRNADRGATGEYYQAGRYVGSGGTLRALYSSDAGTTWSVTSTGGLNTNRVIGRSVVFDDATYGVSWEPFTDGNNRFGLSALQGPQLLQWAGANRADHTTTLGADLTVGSRTVVMAATHPTSLTGMIMTVGTGTSYDNQRWNYTVLNHEAGDDFMTLSQPWGYGDPTITTATSGTSVTFRAQARVFQAPVGIGAVESHKGRLFGARGNIQYTSTQYQFMSNAVFWSYPGNPSHWPSNNYVIVDADYTDPIMALISVPEGLLILKRYKTYIMTGDDESSFAVQLVSSDTGCMHSQGAIPTDNGAVWVGIDGVYTWNGGRITNIAEPQPNRGVSYSTDQHMRLSMLYGDSLDAPFAPTPYYELPSVAYFDDRVWVQYGTMGPSPPINETWVFDTRTGTWSTFTLGDDNGVTQRRVQLVQNLRDTVWAFTDAAAYNVGYCYDAGARTGPSHYNDYETLYDNASGAALSWIDGLLTQVVNPAAHDTVRLRGFEVFHNCQLQSAGTTQVDLFTVTLTPNFGAGTQGAVGTVKARPVNVAQGDYTIPYSDKFTSTASPNEAHLFYVRMATTKLSTAITSSRVHRIRLYLDPQVVRQGWVDPTATAQ